MKRIRVLAVLFVLAICLPAEEVNADGACGAKCNVAGFNFCVFLDDPKEKCWNITGGCISGQSNTCSGTGTDPEQPGV